MKCSKKDFDTQSAYYISRTGEYRCILIQNYFDTPKIRKRVKQGLYCLKCARGHILIPVKPNTNKYHLILIRTIKY